MKNYSKHNFDYVVSSISGFTDQVGGELLTKALMGATTVKEISNQVGIRGTQSLNLLDSAPAFQAGSCGWTSSGTTTYTQRNLTVCQEKINMEWCSDQLRGTYLSMFLEGGDLDTNKQTPFESVIAQNIVDQVQQRVETKIWQATTAGGDCFNGLAALMPTTGNSFTAVSVSGTAFNPGIAYGTNGNPIWEVDKLIVALDANAQVLDDYKVFMSVPNFRRYVQALTAANYFQNYIGSSNQLGSVSTAYALHPNSSAKVVPTIGITGNAVYAVPARYTVFGTNLLDDSEKIDMFYSRDFDVLKGLAKYSYGVQVATFGSLKYFATNGLS